MRQLKKGVGKYEFEDGDIKNEFDFGDIENLKTLFSGLHGLDSYTNKILVTWDHGYSYLMFKNVISATDKSLKNLFNISYSVEKWMEFANLKEIKNIDPNIGEKLTLFENALKANDIPGHDHSSVTKEIDNDPSWVEVKEQIFEKLIISTTTSFPVYDTYDFNFSFAVKELTALTMNELSLAISGSNMKKFDLIVMSNCYMQTIDTAYALRDCCNYLIAPQTTFPWESYDFSSIVPAKNAVVNDEFCKTILTQTQDSLEKKLVPGSGDVQLNEIGFSCIKMANSKVIFEELEKIINFMTDYHAALSDDIYYSANQLCDLTHIDGTNPDDNIRLDQIDLYFLLEFLNFKWNKYPEFAGPYNKLKKEFTSNSFVIDNKKGDIFYWSASSPIPKNACKGVSIFFPKSKKSYLNSNYGNIFIYDGSKTQTMFSKNLRWGYFIEKFFAQFH